MSSTDLVREYVEKWKDTPSLTLAKKLYKEHPKDFLSLELTRSKIRYYRGQKGKHCREAAHDKSHFQVGKLNPFELPKSYAKPRHPVELEGKKTLMLYDPHIPYHDEVALGLAVREGVRRECDAVFLGGDTMDCHKISRFVQDPEAREFEQELAAVQEFLRYLRKKFPRAMIYYKEGNHEERYWKYMRVKAPELIKTIDRVVSMKDLLDLDNVGAEWVHGRTKANIGKLTVLHGHEFGNTLFSPVNPARGLYLKAKASAIAGHMHQSSEHTVRDVNGKMVSCWSVGGLCEMSPEYKPYPEWNHGFAIVERSGNDFQVENKRIYNGKIL